MARLVIVSNRVPAPGQRGQAQAAGGLAVALHNAAHQRDSLLVRLVRGCRGQ